MSTMGGGGGEVPIATEPKTTNSVQGPGSWGVRLLETRHRGPDSRTRIRERFSRIKSPRDRVVSPEGLQAPQFPSFARSAESGRSLVFASVLERNPRLGKVGKDVVG